MELVKIGSFRYKKSNDFYSYLSFKEFYSYPDELKQIMYEQFQQGFLQLYCACCPENNLPLSITKNLVVRVARNGQQALHAESCPKSLVYEHWNDSTENGVKSNEDESIFFNVALPSIIKHPSSGGGSSSSTSSASETAEHRSNVLTIATTLNKYALEIQGYSIKKEIGLAKKENRKPSWEYKDLEAFTRLMFGISNRLNVKVQGEIVAFSSLCYRPKDFYSSDDWQRRYFIYAEIDKISEIKSERKYQYITLKMPSKNSSKKAAIRVETADFLKLYEGYEVIPNGMHLMLAGWVCRKHFTASEGKEESDWIQLLKGGLLTVSEHGIFCENEAVCAVSELLCKRKVLFTRPIYPLENYGSCIPTFRINRKNDRDILIDLVTKRQFSKRTLYATEDNPEFECHLLITEEDYLSGISDIIDNIYNKS